MARPKLTLWPGVGLVASNMVGAGVFLSTGFMAQRLGPGLILLAWLVGAVLALAGARAYAAVATLVPRSGGEYRYLSDLLHPALGYLAGWASLLVGFSAPVAADALAAGAFLDTLGGTLDRRLVGAALVVAITALHAVGMRVSTRVQSVFSSIMASLMVAFAVAGLALGHDAWPRWRPPQALSTHDTLKAFAESLFFVAFAYSGWNAATYATEDFEDPARTVPRSMLAGVSLVALLYLLINWVFVANLTPARAAAVFAYESRRVTLGHLVAADLLGPAGARWMSAAVFLLLASSISAMTFAGPRTFAAMAKDGFLPRLFRGAEGRPPVGALLLQGVLAVAIAFTDRLQQTLSSIGAILTLFAALTALSLFHVRFARRDLPRPSPVSLLAAALYAALACWMLYYGFETPLRELARAPAQPGLLWTNPIVWLLAAAAAGTAAYALTPRAAGARPGRS